MLELGESRRCPRALVFDVYCSESFGAAYQSIVESRKEVPLKKRIIVMTGAVPDLKHNKTQKYLTHKTQQAIVV
jgi:hypothetical protein